MLLILSLALVACKKDNSTAAFGVEDLPSSRDADHGKDLFEKGKGGAVACSSCHSVDGQDRPTAPSLLGIARVAGERVEGESVEAYLLNSIIAPGKHIVKGYSNTMPSNYADQLSKQEIADIIAYLDSLR